MTPDPHRHSITPRGLVLILGVIGQVVGLSAFSQPLPRWAIHYFDKPGPGRGLEM